MHVFQNIITTFLVPSLGNTKPSGDAKKLQQAFLAPLPGIDLKPPHLVIALSNANMHFWRHCLGGQSLKNLVGHGHEHMHVMVATVYVG